MVMVSGHAYWLFAVVVMVTVMVEVIFMVIVKIIVRDYV